MSTVHLDFGSGRDPRNPFNRSEVVTVDTARYSVDLPTHLIHPGSALPFTDSFFDSVSAYDVFEHLSRDFLGKNLFIEYMNELYRVLKPGGLALFVFPAYPHRDAFSDPTHVNYITSESINFFISPGYEGIQTSYEILRNTPLRIWKKYIYEARVSPLSEELNFRRRLSLAKRTFFRFIRPGHQIWILRKSL